jgi:hypothetical protein
MGSAEYGSNRKVRQVAGYIEHSSSDRKTTRNEIIMNKYIKYSFVAVVILVVGFGSTMVNNYNTQPAVEKTEVYTCSMHPEIIRDEPGTRYVE